MAQPVSFDDITRLIDGRPLSSIPRYVGITFDGIEKSLQPLVRRAIESYFTEPKSIFLCGPVGCGKTAAMEIVKTYLVYGVSEYLNRNGLSLHSTWSSESGEDRAKKARSEIKRINHFDLVSQLRQQVDNRKSRFDIDSFGLFVDDLGTAQETEWNLSLLQKFFNSRWEDGKPLFITSNKTPAELMEWPGWSRIVDRILDPDYTIKYNYGDDVKSRRTNREESKND